MGTRTVLLYDAMIQSRQGQSRLMISGSLHFGISVNWDEEQKMCFSSSPQLSGVMKGTAQSGEGCYSYSQGLLM